MAKARFCGKNWWQKVDRADAELGEFAGRVQAAHDDLAAAQARILDRRGFVDTDAFVDDLPTREARRTLLAKGPAERRQRGARLQADAQVASPAVDVGDVIDEVSRADERQVEHTLNPFQQPDLSIEVAGVAEVLCPLHLGTVWLDEAVGTETGVAGFHVVVCARSPEKGDAAVAELAVGEAGVRLRHPAELAVRAGVARGPRAELPPVRGGRVQPL